VAATAALDVIVLGVILVLGALLALAIGRRMPPADLLGLAFPVGTGLLTWLLFIVSWVGVPITLLTAGAVYLVVLLAVGVGLLWRQKGAPVQTEIRAERESPRRHVSWRLALWAAFAMLVMTSAILAVWRSYSAWDDIAIWSVKGYGIAREGTIFAGARWGAHGLSYPLNLPLLISIFRLVDGDVLPGSKLIFPMMYLSLALGCYGFWRHLRVRPWVAGLGMLLIATTPVVFEHGTIGYANLPFACYLVLSVLWYVRANRVGQTGHYVLSGILLGLACWTRPEGLIIGLVVVAALFAARRLAPQGEVRYAAWLVPAALIGGAWGVFAALYAGESQISGAVRTAYHTITEGHLNLHALYRIARYFVRQLLTPSVWGMAFAVCAIAILSRVRGLRPKASPLAFAILMAALGAAVAVIGSYYVASFSGPSLDWWLGTGFNRMLIPGVVLAEVLATLAASHLASPSSPDLEQSPPERNCEAATSREAHS